MVSVPSGDPDRARRQTTTAIRGALRELSLHLSLLNRHVGAHLDLKDVDLDCLDLINAHGPLTPTALAQRAGLHPATMTGILDRLERGGWITREPAPADRRATRIRARRERNAELLGMFAGMNASLEQICADYGPAELELLAGFLQRTSEAGRNATEQIHQELPGKRAGATGRRKRRDTAS
ncbi:MarR family transcriptional regulator [Planomonospora sp. ID67723]|uniref:MarR family winged helix-turn-helix transcriptional regulator n=1 Tax=Planomonospora sp. ID67723 TaxID=2738134 RepID=UPI0018C3C5C1|nr:MarR family transcriptional regulator [Planomonospora sp. ID67723]MBG0831912.1 MarR family transcriptional regulator [Planomonospora sp. ID67723]